MIVGLFALTLAYQVPYQLGVTLLHQLFIVKAASLMLSLLFDLRLLFIHERIVVCLEPFVESLSYERHLCLFRNTRLILANLCVFAKYINYFGHVSDGQGLFKLRFSCFEFLIIDSHLEDFLEGESELDAAVCSLELVAEDFEGSPLHGRVKPFCKHTPLCIVLAQDDDLA